ncbi:MAG: histidine phosphatase family protein, partial [Actinomycetia bacterium]|nr:histidine phosphatase family protein [Actinomycetes bacterium]
MSTEVWMIRHGETEWSANGRHTGTTDLPLTERGRAEARALFERIASTSFAAVLVSPRARALQTAEVAGIPRSAIEIEPDLAEWDYGDYEGLTSDEIRAERPGWTIWNGDPVGGETAAQVRARAQRVIDRVLAIEGRVLLVGHGHMLRVVALTWLDLPTEDGGRFALATATISVLGF